MAKRLDERFVRRGQRAEVLPIAMRAYRVRGVRQRSELLKPTPAPEREAAERERLASAVEERTARAQALRRLGGHSGLWTAPRIVAALRELAGLLNHTPTIAELEKPPRSSWFRPSGVTHRYPS